MKCVPVKFIRFHNERHLEEKAPSVAYLPLPLDGKALLSQGCLMLAIPAAGLESEDVAWLIGVKGVFCEVLGGGHTHFLDALEKEGELGKLGCDDTGAYLKSWGKAYPDVPPETNPKVARLEFRLTSVKGHLDFVPGTYPLRLGAQITTPLGGFDPRDEEFAETLKKERAEEDKKLGGKLMKLWIRQCL